MVLLTKRNNGGGNLVLTGVKMYRKKPSIIKPGKKVREETKKF
jgi:hypothetical protein